MFGGCDNDTVCSKNSLNLQCQSDDESKATGLIGTCTPELDDFSTVPFGDGIFRKCNFAIFLYNIYFNFTGVDMILYK